MVRLLANTLGLVSLGELAAELDLIPVVEIEGVPFSEGEVNQTLLLVNFAAFEDLDRGASIDVRAVDALVFGRPYDSIISVGERPIVGPTTLARLRSFAPEWLAEGGPYSGD